MTELELARKRANEVVIRCKEIFALAAKLYNVDLSKVHIRFDLKGRAAGQARQKYGVYSIRFNRHMLTNDGWDHLYNETIPHEIAHIVCYMRRELGHNHDAGWRRVCIALGGSGARCHNEEVVNGKGYTYECITSTGKTVRLGDKYYKRLQQTGRLTYKDYRIGFITKQSPCKVIGFRGKILDKPKVLVPEGGPAPIKLVTRQEYEARKSA